MDKAWKTHGFCFYRQKFEHKNHKARHTHKQKYTRKQTKKLTSMHTHILAKHTNKHTHTQANEKTLTPTHKFVVISCLEKLNSGPQS